MAGNREGGKKAADTNKQRYGINYYQTIGAIGGSRGLGGGFASDAVGKDGLTGRQRARIAGIKGGHWRKDTATASR